MAYMTEDGRGPYPCYAGEYCGNHLPGSMAGVRLDQSADDAKAEQDRHLARMRFGRPHSCEIGTSSEMVALGYVGLYLKADRGFSLPGDIMVDTPDELKEPTEEAVSNG